MEVLSDHHKIIGHAIVGASGIIDHTEGDAFVAVFADPTAAVVAAVEAERRLSAHRWPR
jgi:class 3 adenylate cyclase